MTDIISLDEAKWQVRVDGNAEDARLQGLIAAAQDHVERYTGLKLTPGAIVETFPAFGALRLRRWPVATDAVVTMVYRDSAGVDQSFTTLRLAASRRPAMVLPAIGAARPYACCAPDAVKVTYVAGYADGQVPALVKRAMLVLIGGWYADREGGETAKAAEASAEAMLKRGSFVVRRL